MTRPTAIILGSAAGGGFPQWNCHCAVCRLAWAGDGRVQARSQAAVAVNSGLEGWLLLNAPPDLRAQIAGRSGFAPSDLRNSPIRDVLLTGAEVDQIAGLLNLRERHPFTLHATAETFATINANPIFRTLDPAIVTQHHIAPGQRVVFNENISAEIFTVPGKVPLFMENGEPAIEETGVNIGVDIFSGGKRIIFMPGIAAMTPAIHQRLEQADVILFDGTLFTDDEMITSGTGIKTGLRMGHMPIDGPDGSLAILAGLRGRKIYIHINNTNPILIDGSPQRLRVERDGCEVAWDGMELSL